MLERIEIYLLAFLWKWEYRSWKARYFLGIMHIIYYITYLAELTLIKASFFLGTGKVMFHSSKL